MTRGNRTIRDAFPDPRGSSPSFTDVVEEGFRTGLLEWFNPEDEPERKKDESSEEQEAE